MGGLHTGTHAGSAIAVTCDHDTATPAARPGCYEHDPAAADQLSAAHDHCCNCRSNCPLLSCSEHALDRVVFRRGVLLTTYGMVLHNAEASGVQCGWKAVQLWTGAH